MLSDDRQPRFMSRPVGVEWAGWRTDTLTLQDNGWEIAVEYDLMRQAYRLLLRHRMMRLFALTTAEQVEHFMEVTSPLYDASLLPIFRVQQVAPTMEVIRMHDDFSNFKQVDAQPCFTTQEVQRVEDMNIFNVPLTRTEEILIDSADMTVIDHLEAIKSLQSEKQKEIRERILREGAHSPHSVVTGATPQTHVHANIVSFEAAA